MFWNGVIGPTFDILCGVRQGGILSPLLFAIYIDDLLRDLLCLDMECILVACLLVLLHMLMTYVFCHVLATVCRRC